MKVFQELFREIRACYPFETALVGFSGGADSAGALLLLLEQSQSTSFQTKAVHFEHGLRGPRGRADAEWCERFCDDRGVPFQRINLDVPANARRGESVEQAARRLRLRQLAELCGPFDATGTVAVLGHHADDKVENLFLRLLRGSNASGLASPSPVARLGSLTVIRPLLNCEHRQIVDYLRSRGVEQWLRDETNDDTRFLRNLIRHDVLPTLYEGADFARKGLARSIQNLDMDKNFIESQADAAHSRTVKSGALSVSAYESLHPALRPRVLRRWLSERGAMATIPGHHLVERIDSEASATNRETKTIPVDGHLEITIRNGVMTLTSTRPPPPIGPRRWDWRRTPIANWGKWTIRTTTAESSGAIAADDHLNALFDADALPDALTLRPWRPGDRLVPFGSQSPVKAKKLFTAAGVNAEEKATTPVVCLEDDDILWIPGVKRSNRAPVTESTSSVVHCRAETTGDITP